jgi:hypothetical protein
MAVTIGPSVGHVVAHFVDPGGQPTEGEVRFALITPAPQPATILAPRTAVAPIVDDVARDVLHAGLYRVSYHLVGSALPSHTATVTPEHTLEAPLKLTTASILARRSRPTR